MRTYGDYDDDFLVGKTGYTFRFLVIDCARFLKDFYWNEILELAYLFPDTQTLHVKAPDISKFGHKLENALFDYPQIVLDALNFALSIEIVLPIEKDLTGATVRITNFTQNRVSVHAIRETHIDQFLSVEGIVRKATSVQAIYSRVAFRCLRCEHETVVQQSSHAYIAGKMEEPFAGCENDTCGKNGPFRINNKESTFVDFQKLLLQEPPETIQNGGQPQSLEIIVSGDITGNVVPGNRVVITGILNAVNVVTKEGRAISCKYALSANYIEHIDKGFREVKISEEDEKAIWELSKDPDLLTKLVNSVAPSIFGYEDIKTAILLQLFSGIPKIAPDKAWLRGDIHIMLIGDPGIAKSQLLRYVLQIAPRANFSSGLGSTKAGLTASAVKDELKNGSWTIEAGVLPMTNEGVVCADEIDKMREEDRSGLHEAMEQQTVTVIKAGLNMTLSSKCSILAAANPKGGRFNDYDSIAEQINMPPPLLSRFDLIFVLTDKPNEETDRLIANHILKTHKVSTHHTSAHTSLSGSYDPDPLMVSLYPYNQKKESILGELDYFGKPYVEPELMRQYIAYSRKNIFPELSPEIHDMLTELYIGLRRHNYGAKGKKLPISITPRQLEGLIRLSEAAARIRLSNVVTEDDARLAISLVRGSLTNVGVDSESGVIDIDKILLGESHSQREKVQMIYDIMKAYSEENHTNKIPIVEIIKEMVNRAVPDYIASEILNKLIKRGNIAKISAEHVIHSGTR